MSLRTRIFLELLVTPFTIVPFLLGGSLLLLCEFLGGYSAFLGLAGMLVGVGVFLTNMLFNLETISTKVIKQWQSELSKKRDKELDSLYKKLERTEGTSDENALKNLRVLYKAFTSDIAGGKLSKHVPQQMLKLIDDIFTTCVLKLERSYEIYQTSKSMTGKLQRDMDRQRGVIINEVESSVLELSGVINEVRTLKYKNESNELRKLQEKLSYQLDVAKATEEDMAVLLSGENYSLDQRLKELE